MAGRPAAIAIWWAWLLGCLVFVIDLGGVAVVLGHTTWAAVVRLVCAAVLLPFGLLTVQNRMQVRQTLVRRFVRSESRSRLRANVHRHLINLLLVVLGCAWIGIGMFN